MESDLAMVDYGEIEVIGIYLNTGVRMTDTSTFAGTLAHISLVDDQLSHDLLSHN